MFFGRLKRQFTARRRAEDGRPISAIWVTDREQATRINPDSGRVHAYVSHDGQGLFYPTVIVSPWRALKLLRCHAAVVVSLLSFPRCTVELRSLGCDTLGLAEQQAEYGLGLYD